MEKSCSRVSWRDCAILHVSGDATELAGAHDSGRISRILKWHLESDGVAKLVSPKGSKMAWSSVSFSSIKSAAPALTSGQQVIPGPFAYG